MAESPYLEKLEEKSELKQLDLEKKELEKLELERLNNRQNDSDDESDRSDLPIESSKAKTLIPKILVVFLVLGLLGGFAYWGWNTFGVNNQESRRRVRSGVVERGNLYITVSANGTVQPEKLINASPKTSGRLKSLIVKEGDRVTEGQILAYMDDSNLRGQLVQAQGQLASAEANLNKLIAGNRPQDYPSSGRPNQQPSQFTPSRIQS
jgi:multidrug efflux pump subunit AcrA (membrane-fusion protein)